MPIAVSNLRKPIAYREGHVSHNLPGGVSPKTKCTLCGCTGAESLLNIEGRIHHGAKVTCLDTLNCNRRQRRNRRRNHGNLNS